MKIRLPQLILKAGACLLLMLPPAVHCVPSAIRIETEPGAALVRFLGWDTEGGNRASANLLRTGTGLGLRVRAGGQWRSGADLPAQHERVGRNDTRYRLSVSADAELTWNLAPESDSLGMRISGQGAGWNEVEAIELVFPFDPRVTPTTVLPEAWNDDGSLRLPAIISAPDFGQMLLAYKGSQDLKGRLEGSRARHTVDLVLELPALRAGQSYALSLTPVRLSAPGGLKDKSLWPAARLVRRVAMQFQVGRSRKSV